MTTADERLEAFWAAQDRRNATRVTAACRAVGRASVWLRPESFTAESDRLVHLRNIIRELAEELGLPEISGLGNKATTTKPTDGSNL